VSNFNPEQEANQAVVEAACIALREAARNLTPDIEAAAIYSIEPHGLREEISDEERQ
jgi:hypothetical protein